LSALPKIDGWKPSIQLLELDEIAQMRLDAEEVGEFECKVSVEQSIEEPAKLLREYRYRFSQKRREMIRDSLIESIDRVDNLLRQLGKFVSGEFIDNASIESPLFGELKADVAKIDMLLGSSMTRPSRWGDLHRHFRFGLLQDLKDIVNHDWPSVKAGLRKDLYGEHDPLPLEVDDLGTLVKEKPRGSVATKLRWDTLSEEDFERLIFALISNESGYENPEWLMKTNASDRGRDLSVYRVHSDSLSGKRRDRIIIQCKHWLSKSISAHEIAALREQMALWDSPRIDICIIATSGRFTSDAVALIEKHNQSDRALRVEMWAESHLELLLASRPSLIAEFSLR
jgi:hypothetical protein